jgi:hypothetical protein
MKSKIYGQEILSSAHWGVKSGIFHVTLSDYGPVCFPEMTEIIHIPGCLARQISRRAAFSKTQASHFTRMPPATGHWIKAHWNLRAQHNQKDAKKKTQQEHVKVIFPFLLSSVDSREVP